MIVLFTDFGLDGPYVGSVEAALMATVPGVDVVRLMSDAPAFDPRTSAYLLAALTQTMPVGSILLCVVDPGVGGDRLPCVMEADGRWFVGPGNGLFEIVARRSKPEPKWWEIVWRPERLSASFHGRDLFAPIAARLAQDDRGGLKARDQEPFRRRDWPDELAQIIYIDSFGNAMTGVRAASVSWGTHVLMNGRTLRTARTFSDVSEGDAFVYENAYGLIEIAVNKGRADNMLELEVGSSLEFVGL